MTVETDTLEVIGHRWESARLIWSNVNCWGFTSVRHALTKLEALGKIEAKYVPHPNGSVIMYRRPTVPRQESSGDADR